MLILKYNNKTYQINMIFFCKISILQKINLNTYINKQTSIYIIYLRWNCLIIILLYNYIIGKYSNSIDNKCLLCSLHASIIYNFVVIMHNSI